MKTLITFLLGAAVITIVLIGFAKNAEKNAPKQVAATPKRILTKENSADNTKASPTVTTVATGLRVPWGLAFLPNGDLLATERGGNVRIIRKDLGLDQNILLSIQEVKEIGEGGLLGIAIHPDYPKKPYVYFYYTYKGNNANIQNRLVRFTLQKEKFSDPQVLIDNIPAASNHDGGRIKFGPDGKLYAATGDATIPYSAQDKNSLSGKILRMNKDGSVPEDNPFGNYAYSYGHRNPQGIAWNPDTMALYESEHGQSRNDEINIIVKGGNYGWPTECTEPGDYAAAIRCYSEFTLAPSGIAFYGNDLYVAGLRGSQLRRIVFDRDHKTILSEEELFSSLGRTREVVEHNGYLYISTSNRDGRGIPGLDDDKIIRIKKINR